MHINKNSISATLKANKTLYKTYYYTMSNILRFMGLFLRIDPKLILFNSFGGKKFDDSPKEIYYQMKNDPRFAGYKLMWVINDPDLYCNSKEMIKTDTLKFFITALSAKMWITNSSMERGLRFKKKGTLYLNTWHGSAIKLMGIDIPKSNNSFHAKLSSADIMLAQSEYDVKIFSRVFEIPKEKFRCFGLPRNDVLSNYIEKDKAIIKKNLGLPSDKKVLLYAPTFREFTRNDRGQIELNIPINLKKWQEKLGKNYVVLFRAHYEVARHMKVEGYGSIIDMSEYPTLSDLMIISDALITDYSSICFDYSIMHKPIYCFAYDYVEYVKNRGVYFELEKELPCRIHYSEDSLIEDILSGKSELEFRDQVIQFQQKYATHNGSAAKKTCDLAYAMLTNNSN